MANLTCGNTSVFGRVATAAVCAALSCGLWTVPALAESNETQASGEQTNSTSEAVGNPVEGQDFPEKVWYYKPNDDGSKVKTPVVEKEVFEDSNSKWQEIADAGTNEHVKYRCTGTMADFLDEYKTYAWWLIDSPADGMDVEESSIKAYLTHANGVRTEVTDQLDIVKLDHGFKIGSDDIIKAIDGVLASDTIVCEYECVFQNGFGIGMSDPNDNFAHIEHTTSQIDGSMSSSTEDKARVLTWALRVVKTDKGQTKPLADATFEILDGSEKTLATVKTDENGFATIRGVDSGTYVLRETKAPAGYDKVGDITLTIEASWKGSTKASIKATAKGGAKVSDVDSGTGLVTLAVEDPVAKHKDGGPDDKNKNNNSNNNGGPSNSASSSAGGPLSKTADALVAWAPWLIGAGATMGVGMLIGRRRNSRD